VVGTRRVRRRRRGASACAARPRGRADVALSRLGPRLRVLDATGLPLQGPTRSPAWRPAHGGPLQLIGAKKRIHAGAGDLGLRRVYTTPGPAAHLLADRLANAAGSPLASSTKTPRDKALSLRGLAQQGDALALELFDLQARRAGAATSPTCVWALDPQYVVIGGGLMDPESTSERSGPLPAHRARDGEAAHVAGTAPSESRSCVALGEPVAGGSARRCRA